MQLLSTLALATVATALVAPPVARTSSNKALRSISDTESEIVAVEPVEAEAAAEPVIIAPTPVAAPPRGWDVSLDMPAGIVR